jgi:hypothetical protein
MRRFGLALAAFLFSSALAFAQQVPNNGSPMVPTAAPGGGAGSGTVSNCAGTGNIAYYASAGTTVGCSTGITASNSALTLGSGVTLNGAIIHYGLRQDGAGTASAGSSYVAGDIVTLSGGTCSTQPTVVIWNATGPIFSVENPGNCTVVPSDPVSGTGGSGTGFAASLVAFWGPWASNVPSASFINNGPNGAVFYPPALGVGALNPALGPMCFGNPGSCGGGGNSGDGMGGGTGLSGAEDSFLGYYTGAQVTSGQWLTFVGHNAGGHETTGSFEVLVGTDAGKWTTGGNDFTSIGISSGKFQLNPSGVVILGSAAAEGGQFAATVSGAVSNAGACELTVNSTTGMVTGDTAVVTGVAGATGCNGVITNVTVTDSTHLTLTGTTFGGSYTSGGSVEDYGSIALAGTVVIGNGALSSTALRSAGGIVVVGAGAATSVQTSNNFVVIGNNAATNLTTGNSNTIVGDAAGDKLTTGGSNFIGGLSANTTATGTNNAVVIGENAQGASDSVIIGGGSGNSNLSGTFMTVLGYQIAHSACTSAASDILIGVDDNVDCGSGSDAHAIVIATQASQTSGGSNTINVEGIWKATGTGTPSTSTTSIASSTINLPNIANAAGNEILCYDTTGGPVTYESAVAGCVPSGDQFKNLLGVIDGKKAAQDIVLIVQPAIYTYKDTVKFGEQEYDGLRAQQMCRLSEHLCVRDPITHEPKNYDKIGALAFAFAAIKYQQQMLGDMESKIERLERRGQ